MITSAQTALRQRDPIVRSARAMTTDSRMPVRITGRASGELHAHRRCSGFQPFAACASIVAGGRVD